MATNKQNILAVRDVVREAFDRLGGADWLVTFAQASPENARVFVSLVGRLIPTELVGKGGAPLSIIIKKEGDEAGIAGTIIEGQFRAESEPKILQ
jgi:hypothetical protein